MSTPTLEYAQDHGQATTTDHDHGIDLTLDHEDEESDGHDLAPGEIFHLLQNERRRLVLKYLRDKPEPVRMRDVAEQVAAWEHDTTPAQLRSKQRQRVYIPLYQMHLPKLAEAGVIEYRQARGIVTRTPLADMLDPYLEIDADDLQEQLETTTPDWTKYYLGATVIGAVMVFGAVIELPFLAAMSGVALALVILLIFTAVTLSRRVAETA